MTLVQKVRTNAMAQSCSTYPNKHTQNNNKYKYLYIGRPLLLLSREDDFNKYNFMYRSEDIVTFNLVLHYNYTKEDLKIN